MLEYFWLFLMIFAVALGVWTWVNQPEDILSKEAIAKRAKEREEKLNEK